MFFDVEQSSPLILTEASGSPGTFWDSLSYLDVAYKLIHGTILFSECTKMIYLRLNKHCFSLQSE